MTSVLRNLSIKRKLMLVTMVTSCAALLVACTLFAIYDYASARETLIRETSTMAAIVGSNSTAALSFDDPEEASTILRRLRAQDSIRTAVIFDPVGRTFASFVTPEWPATHCQDTSDARFTANGLGCDSGQLCIYIGDKKGVLLNPERSGSCRSHSGS